MLFATLRLVVFTSLALAVAAYVIIKAVAARRAGRPYRFGALDGGLLFHGREVDPRWMLFAATIYLVGIGSLLAWPLGAYDWLASSTSGCRALVTDDELQALAPGFEPLDVHHLETSCSATSWGPGVRGRYEATLDAGLGRNLDYEMSLRPGTRSELPGGVVRVDRGHEVDLYFTHRQAGVYVALSSQHFDEREISRVAQQLVDRGPDLLAPFEAAERASLEGPSFVRRHAIGVFLGTLGSLAILAMVVFRVRQARAMRRALEE
ncbi:MAG: hypothetical protein MUE69_21115 [Myxococcota bacterium]|nr:hypothetical protein [Myxococcota bacterium]